MDQNQANIPAEPEFKTACGGKIKDTSKYPSADYRGEQIYFCTRACLRVFENDPDAFMASDVEHPLEED
ncbi:MAG: YHS domain-containing protein [Chloroflexi bacterium]|nr:YHS domain-containing protein [Chloroflexota bacterium]